MAHFWFHFDFAATSHVRATAAVKERRWSHRTDDPFGNHDSSSSRLGLLSVISCCDVFCSRRGTLVRSCPDQVTGTIEMRVLAVTTHDGRLLHFLIYQDCRVWRSNRLQGTDLRASTYRSPRDVLRRIVRPGFPKWSGRGSNPQPQHCEETPLPRRIARKAPLGLALWLKEVNRGFLTASRFFACYRSTPGFRIVPRSTGATSKLVSLDTVIRRPVQESGRL